MCVCVCVCVCEAQTGNRRNSSFQRNPRTGLGVRWRRKVQIKPHLRENFVRPKRKTSIITKHYIYRLLSLGFFSFLILTQFVCPENTAAAFCYYYFFPPRTRRVCSRSRSYFFSRVVENSRISYGTYDRGVCAYIYSTFFFCFDKLNSFSC